MIDFDNTAVGQGVTVKIAQLLEALSDVDAMACLSWLLCTKADDMGLSDAAVVAGVALLLVQVDFGETSIETIAKGGQSE